MRAGTTDLLSKGDNDGGKMFCNSFFDTPIIVTNKLLLRCIVRDGVYIPNEIISMQKFLNKLKELNAFEKNASTEMEKQKRSLDSCTYNTVHKPLRGSINPRHHKHQSTYQRRRKSTATSVSSVLLELSTDTGYNSSNNDFSGDNDIIFNNHNNNATKNRKNSLPMNEHNRSEDEDTTTNENDHLTSMESDLIIRRGNRNDLQAKYEDHVNWMMEDNDYISMETVPSLDDFEVLLDVIIKCGCPMGLSVRVEHAHKGFTVLLHLIESFKKDFMVVRIGEKHCLFMEPF